MPTEHEQPSSSEEEKSRKKRVAAKGWVTRTSNTLKDLLKTYKETKNVNPKELADAIDCFDKRFASYEEAQTAYELFIKEEDLDQDIQESELFIRENRKPRIEAASLLEQTTPSSADPDSISDVAAGSNSENASSQSSQSKPYSALPKINLPIFSGSFMEWVSFYDQFNAIIHNSDIPAVSKFVYLQSVLKGEAKAVIQGLSLTEEHYLIARDLLEQRYGRKEKLIFAHIQELLNIQIPSNVKSKVTPLWELQDKLLTNIRCLEKLNVSGKEYGVILTPLILSRLPSELRIEWARLSENKESDLDFLLHFLKTEIDSRERSQTFNTSAQNYTHSSASSNSYPTATSLSTITEPANCNLCNKRHPTEKCWNWNKMTIDERVSKIKELGLCFICLNKKHIAKYCKKNCSKCHEKHHFILCKKVSKNLNVQTNPKKQEGKDEPVTVTNNSSDLNLQNLACTVSSKSVCSNVVMQIAKIPVHSEKGVTIANVLFDTGSNRTYVSNDFVQRAQPELIGCETVSYASFGQTDKGSSRLRNVFSLNLKHANSDNCSSIAAIEIPVICTPIFCPSISEQDLHQFKGLKFANNYKTNQRITIDILMGMDLYWSFVKSTKIGSDNFVAVETLFGWILSGSPSEAHVNDPSSSVSLLCFNSHSDDVLHKFWDLESVGVTDNVNDTPHPVLSQFENTISFDKGRYKVSLPWKPDQQYQLQDNEFFARRRLEYLTKKLSKNKQLEDGYNQYFRDLESKGMIEEVPPDEISSENPIFYLPHRPVVKEGSLSTKIRPVFDASASGSSSISLNKCLEVGPNLLTDLVEILIRFRRWPVAVTGDIKKAFLQIEVNEKDRDVHRFLWNENGHIRIMRLTRVPFGNCSSPFLLNATIGYHLKNVKGSPVVEELKDNMYVDNFMTGGDSDEMACLIIRESSKILESGGFPMEQWCSNSPVVGNMLDREFTDKNLNSENSVKALGIKWFASDDSFGFDGFFIPDGLIVTKRVVLSFIAKLFDPLGLISPFIMTVKTLFQDVWKLGIEWDEEINDELKGKFFAWMEGLRALKEWKVPRSYTGLPWHDIESVQIHGFGDASPKAYGSCVYIVCLYKNQPVFSKLVISRARVAPLKSVSLPRLELLGALLCARLVKFVKKALRLSDETDIRCWTDSRVTLAWIKGNPSRWKAFVANRVVEIQEITNPANWGFVKGSDNPADLVTRGLLANELMSSELWLNGPSFIKSYISQKNTNIDLDTDIDTELPLVECCNNAKNITLLSTEQTGGKPCFDIERWSSFDKALRVLAWVFRFTHNISSSVEEKKTGELSIEELTNAKLKILISIQKQDYNAEIECLKNGMNIPKTSDIYKLGPFIDSDGLLRVGGRLQFSDLSFEEKHPIILAKGHTALLITRFYHKLLKHAGISSLVAAVRRQYWIVGLRVIAKRVKKQCFACQRQDTLPCEQCRAPLPKDRVTQAPPFNITGIDHFGPLYCTDFSKKKFYVLLFTCAVVRAVHLELVDSLNAFDALLAMRRFMSRRGLPAIIYSDNAKTFKSLKGKMLSLFGHTCPKWKFIAPRSPWWGGFWERMVKSVKSATRKTVGSSFLTRSELER